MEGIQVSTEVAGKQNQISIIKVGGFIDTTTSSEVERALNSLLKQGRYNIIIDLGNVDYISSAGWGIFISEIKSIRENNGDLKLVRMIPDVYEIFELLEFHHILEVYDSVEEAIQKFEEITPKSKETEVTEQTFSKSPASLTNSSARSEYFPPRPESNVAQSTIPVKKESDKNLEKRAKKEVPLYMQSLENKIKYIVARNPKYGAYRINKILNTEEFGFTRVGWFGVRSILNKLGLNSRKKRSKFALQYAKENFDQGIK